MTIGDAEMASARLAVLSGIPLLDETEGAKALARHLLQSQIIPAGAAPDGVHLALAAAYRMFLPM